MCLMSVAWSGGQKGANRRPFIKNWYERYLPDYCLIISGRKTYSQSLMVKSAPMKVSA
jgi:hypothetical protein